MGGQSHLSNFDSLKSGTLTANTNELSGRNKLTEFRFYFELELNETLLADEVAICCSVVVSYSKKTLENYLARDTVAFMKVFRETLCSFYAGARCYFPRKSSAWTIMVSSESLVEY